MNRTQIGWKAAALAAAALALGALACNLPSQQQEQPTPQPTVTLTPEPGAAADTPIPLEDTPAATAAAETAQPSPSATLNVAVPLGEPPARGAVVFETRFQSGWPDQVVEGATGTGRSTATEGGYQFDVSESWAHWAYTNRFPRSNFYAEVSARPLSCPAGRGEYGVMFHYENSDRFRIFTVTCSGGYTLFQREMPGDGIRLASGNLPDGIDPTAGEHVLAVRALNNVLTLYMDNYQLAEVPVGSSPEGSMGMYVGTGSDALSILFTRLAVYEAE